MRPADTAVDDMENLNFPIRNDLSSINPWHNCHSAKQWWDWTRGSVKKLASQVKVHGT
jgi:hypothetical protein